MSAACPACGVAVVPGYVRCPRCHAALPVAGASRRNTSTVDPGGTSVAQSGMPRWFVWALGIGGGVLVLWLVVGWVSDAFSDYSKKAVRDASVEQVDPQATPGTNPQGVRPTPGTGTPSGDSPSLTPTQPAVRNGPSAAATVAELERALRRRRLWSTVELVGSRVDVRSGSCGDANMSPMIESMRGAMRGAGLTRLRCLEQSGRVVFERDL
jgi:hypothetical protein